MASKDDLTALVEEQARLGKWFVTAIIVLGVVGGAVQLLAMR